MPLIQRASSDARNATAAATSPGMPTPLRWARSISSRSASPAVATWRCAIGVWTSAGATQTQRRPVGASSEASDWVSPVTPALLAE